MYAYHIIKKVHRLWQNYGYLRVLTRNIGHIGKKHTLKYFWSIQFVSKEPTESEAMVKWMRLKTVWP